MIELKVLIVVLGLSVIVFALAKPVALQFSAEADFKRRRNVWMALTVVAFLSPNIWLFALLAAPVLYWGGRKDSNPLAFYLLLLMIIPPVSRQIPTIYDPFRTNSAAITNGQSHLKMRSVKRSVGTLMSVR